MGIWNSRADKEPPAAFFAEVVAYLDRSYPRAALDRDVMETLKPFLAREWRSGQSAHDAAKATCACDGLSIVPSPATAIELGRRAVRPPKGAARGSVFGLEDVREPATLVKARVDVEVARRHAEHYTAIADKLESASPKTERARSSREVKLFQARQEAAKWALEATERISKLRDLTALATWTQRDELVPKPAPRRAKSKSAGLDYTPRAFPARSAGSPDGGGSSATAGASEATAVAKPSKPPKIAKAPKVPKVPKAPKPPKAAKPPKVAKPPNAPCTACKPAIDDDLDALVAELADAELTDLTNNEGGS